jgi:replication factor A1
MHEEIKHLYEQIKDIKTKKEFLEEIKQLQKESDELFDEKTSALLIVDKYGKNTESISKIGEIKDKKDCTVIGKITRIQNQRQYTRKNGSKGEVANLEIEDESGKCTLVLWNKDCDLLKNNEIKEGSYVKIINGYIKDGFNGTEINIGRYGLIEIIKKETDIKSKKENTLQGKIIEITETRPFFRDNGEYGFVADIKLQSKNDVKKITIWDEKVKEIQNFKIGDNITLSDVDIKNRNGQEEIHINGRCKIQKN